MSKEPPRQLHPQKDAQEAELLLDLRNSASHEQTAQVKDKIAQRQQAHNSNITSKGLDKIKADDDRVRPPKQFTDLFDEKVPQIRLGSPEQAAHAEDCFMFWAYYNGKIDAPIQHLLRYNAIEYLSDTQLREDLMAIKTTEQMLTYLRNRYKIKTKRIGRPRNAMKKAAAKPANKQEAEGSQNAASIAKPTDNTAQPLPGAPSLEKASQDAALMPPPPSRAVAGTAPPAAAGPPPAPVLEKEAELQPELKEKQGVVTAHSKSQRLPAVQGAQEEAPVQQPLPLPQGVVQQGGSGGGSIKEEVSLAPPTITAQPFVVASGSAIDIVVCQEAEKVDTPPSPLDEPVRWTSVSDKPRAVHRLAQSSAPAPPPLPEFPSGPLPDTCYKEGSIPLDPELANEASELFIHSAINKAVAGEQLDSLEVWHILARCVELKLPVSLQAPQKPRAGAIFLMNKKKTAYKRDGYTFSKESHSTLKVQGEPRLKAYYCTLPDGELSRRSYWSLSSPDLVLVHYFKPINKISPRKREGLVDEEHLESPIGSPAAEVGEVGAEAMIDVDRHGAPMPIGLPAVEEAMNDREHAQYASKNDADRDALRAAASRSHGKRPASNLDNLNPDALPPNAAKFQKRDAVAEPMDVTAPGRPIVPPLKSASLFPNRDTGVSTLQQQKEPPSGDTGFPRNPGPSAATSPRIPDNVRNALLNASTSSRPSMSRAMMVVYTSGVISSDAMPLFVQHMASVKALNDEEAVLNFESVRLFLLEGKVEQALSWVEEYKALAKGSGPGISPT